MSSKQNDQIPPPLPPCLPGRPYPSAQEMLTTPAYSPLSCPAEKKPPNINSNSTISWPMPRRAGATLHLITLTLCTKGVDPDTKVGGTAYMSTQREVLEGQTGSHRAKRANFGRGVRGSPPRKISKTYMANGAIYVIPELYL